MGGSPGEVREVPVTWVKQWMGCRMTCDVDEVAEGFRMSCGVDEAAEGLENEL